MKGLTLGLLAMLALMAAPAYAFKLTPIEAEFGPGRLASQTFKVGNGGTLPVAIELSVHARAMADNGDDILAPAPLFQAVSARHYRDSAVNRPGFH